MKRGSRKAYRQSNQVARQTPALLIPGVEKEVFTDEMDFPVTAEVYTIPDSAKALGKTPLTIKRWVKDNLIPPPVLLDAVNGYRHYSKGELNIICELLHEYSQDYSYLVSDDNPFVHSVWQKLEHYRRTSI